ncbi:MAG TPA: hypothetical protein VG672_18060 [Bryobacteraceae bacterium]|nr:hypothetical protein [Bryobacteraceae bacterium]
MLKLAELRIKTDHDLVCVIRKEIERGVTLASVATSKQSPLYVRAENSYHRVELLLFKISNSSAADCAALRSELKAFRAALDTVPNVLKMHGGAACPA